MRFDLVAVSVFVTLALDCAEPLAASLDERCRQTKLAAIAAGTSTTFKCFAQALRSGASVDPACLAQAEARLAQAFTRAERFVPCPPTSAEAYAALAPYVAQQAARVAAAPTATPAPTPTPGPTSAPVCGNGVVEPGEKCDGFPGCTSACEFELTACCAVGLTACFDVPDVTIPSSEGAFCQELVQMGVATGEYGMRCMTSDPNSCSGGICTGPCAPVTFPPTKFCCDGGDACGDQTFTDSAALGWYMFGCGPWDVHQGSCVAGECVPGG